MAGPTGPPTPPTELGWLPALALSLALWALIWLAFACGSAML